MKRAQHLKLAQWSLALFLIDFFFFLLTSLYLGGDALTGHVEDGRFFLNDHGIANEASETIFRFSQMLELSVLALFIVAIVSHFTLPRDLQQGLRAQAVKRSYFILLMMFISGLAFIGLQRVFNLHYHY